MNNKDQVYKNVDLMKFKVETPSYQRVLNNNHVIAIYNEFLKYIKMGVRPPFQLIDIGYYYEIIGTISIPKYYIIDGQHRYEAYLRLLKEGYKFLIDLHAITCVDVVEAENLYKLGNSRLQHANCELNNQIAMTDLDKKIQEFIYAETRYFNFKSNGQRPKIRVQEFMDRWMISNIRTRIKSIDEFRAYLSYENTKYKNKFHSDIQFRSNLKLTDGIIHKAADTDWYLGLDLQLGWLI